MSAPTPVEHCEIGELPVDQCACRIHGPAPEKVEITVKFIASYDSRCHACKGQINGGDIIGRTIDGDYVCGECCP